MTIDGLIPQAVDSQSSFVLLDANLLTLLLVGRAHPWMIGRGATSEFKKGHFILLAKLVSTFRGILTTPHILTEASNHLANRSPMEYTLATHFESFVREASEWYLPVAKTDPSMLRLLGVADTVSIAALCAERDTVLLSTDGTLCNQILSLDLKALNFREFQTPYADMIDNWG